MDETDHSDFIPLVKEGKEISAYYKASNDYILSSHTLEPPKEDYPIFKKSLMLLTLLSGIFKLIVCIIFFMYYHCTSISVYFVVTVVVSVIYYTKVLYMLISLYKNIKADRLPYTWTQRIISLIIDVICPSYFVYLFYASVFINGEFFISMFNTRGQNCVMVSYIFFVSLVMYLAGMIYDLTDFVFSRIWTGAILNTSICY